MTCKEFLTLLQENPNKELEFKRIYNSDDNGKLSSYGTKTIQKLGKITNEIDVKSNKVTIIINQFL